MPPPGRSAPRSAPLWRVAGGAHPSALLVRGRTQVTLLWEFRSHFQSPFWLLLRLALLLLPVLAAHPAHAVTAAQLTTAVDVYMSMESGLGGNTVTTNLLNAATHGQGGWWSLFPNTVSELTVSPKCKRTLLLPSN